MGKNARPVVMSVRCRRRGSLRTAARARANARVPSVDAGESDEEYGQRLKVKDTDNSESSKDSQMEEAWKSITQGISFSTQESSKK